MIHLPFFCGLRYSDRVEVKLRNFPLSLSVLHRMDLRGAVVLARHFTLREYLFTELVPIKHCRTLGGALLQNVSLSRSKVPFKIFHDVELRGKGMEIGMCPEYIHSVYDLVVRLLIFPQIVPELLDAYGANLPFWDLMRFLCMGRLMMDWRAISMRLVTKSKSLMLPSTAVNVAIASMKGVLHNSHIRLSVQSICLTVDQFVDDRKYSPLLVCERISVH